MTPQMQQETQQMQQQQQQQQMPPTPWPTICTQEGVLKLGQKEATRSGGVLQGGAQHPRCVPEPHPDPPRDAGGPGPQMAKGSHLSDRAGPSLNSPAAAA